MQDEQQKRVVEILDETWDTDDRKPPAQLYHLPKQIDAEKTVFKRAKSARGFLAAWKRLREAVWVARGVPYKKLPDFAARWGKRLYETHERVAYDALCDGDVFFFDAWSGRLVLMDRAAEDAGLNVVERGTILFAIGVLQGYAEAAAKRLKVLGGKWPPKRQRR